MAASVEKKSLEIMRHKQQPQIRAEIDVNRLGDSNAGAATSATIIWQAMIRRDYDNGPLLPKHLNRHRKHQPIAHQTALEFALPEVHTNHKAKPKRHGITTVKSCEVQMWSGGE